MNKRLTKTAQFFMHDGEMQAVWFTDMSYDQDENVYVLQCNSAVRYFVPREAVSLFRIFPSKVYS